MRPALRSAASNSSNRRLAPAELGGLGPGQQRGELVPEGEEAGRLEADDPGAGPDEGQQRVEGAPGLGAGPVGLARGEVGPPAAERAACR